MKFDFYILGEGFKTVGELTEALKKLGPDTPLTPFGYGETALAYDEKNNMAYLDEKNFIDELITEETQRSRGKNVPCI